MSENTTLNATFAGLSFLSRNTLLARAFGRDGVMTKRFSDSEEKDAYERSAATWNGLNESGVYDVGDVSDFRGLYSDGVTLLNGSNKSSSILGERFVGPIFTSVENILERPVTSGNVVNAETEDEKSVLQKLRGDAEDRAYLGDEVLSDRLYSESTSVRDLISGESDLADAYTTDASQSASALPGQLNDYASLELLGIESGELVNEGELSRLITENRGEITDRLNNSSELRDLIGASAQETLLNEARDAVIDEVLPKLKNSSEILTEDVLRDNPLVALDLLQRPAFRDWVEEDTNNARSVLSDLDNISNRVRGEMIEDAAITDRSTPYDKAWFETNTRFAEVMASERETGGDTNLREFIYGQQNDPLYEESANELAKEYWRERADKATGGVLPDHLTEESDSLALLAGSDEGVAGGLAADSEAINTSYPEGNNYTDALTAYRAWGLGLGDRLYGEYTRVA